MAGNLPVILFIFGRIFVIGSDYVHGRDSSDRPSLFWRVPTVTLL